MNERKLLRLFPNASRDTVAANAQIPAPEPEQDQANALGCAAAGKETRLGRIIVRVTSRRVRLLDDDNHSGSVKDIIDGLRHANRLIPGDSRLEIFLITDQIKVNHFSHERTDIELIYP